MKKLYIYLLSFLFVLGGGLSITSPLISYADEQNSISISTTGEFITAFTSSATYNDSNVSIILNADLNFEGEDLSRIYKSKNIFCGTFDGNGHTISNLNLTSQMYYYGLFPYTRDATIKNLQITGEVTFDFDSENIQELYAGILVGYGENTIIENCELYDIALTLEGEQAEQAEETQDEQTEGEQDEQAQEIKVELPIYSNINFGSLAGKLTGNPRLTAGGNVGNVLNCISYYDIAIDVQHLSNVNIGGLVGQLEQGYIQNSLNFGDISFVNNTTDTSSSSSSFNIGGLVGYISGTQSQLKNSCFGGDYSTSTNNENINLAVGAIAGSVSNSSRPPTSSVNFDYFTTSNLTAFGDDTFVVTSEKFGQVSSISIGFLKNTSNFDPAALPWDFDLKWMQKESRMHLQCFQYFDYSINSTIDVTRVFGDAYFTIEEQEEGEQEVQVKYDKVLYVNLFLQEEYYGYYGLKSILLNSSELSLGLNYNNYTLENEIGYIVGYKIPIKVNDTTDGIYSFTVEAKEYEGFFTISEDAKESSQGGIRWKNASSTATSQELSFDFTLNSAVRQIEAVGNNIYTFDYWELYYYADDGTLESVQFENYTNSTLTIRFGQEPFTQAFRLVAYFTNEKAIRFSFDGLNNGFLKSINVGGVLYENSPIAVSPKNSALNIEIITIENYVLDYEAFLSNLKNTYNENVVIMTSDPVKNEETGETTYTFRMNMNYIGELTDNSLTLTVNVAQDTSNNDNNLLWLYIVLPIAGVVIIGVVIFIIIRRRGGGKKKKGPAKKVEEKQPSYKDYYI